MELKRADVYADPQKGLWGVGKGWNKQLALGRETGRT